jgi:hypothetical protein
MRPILLCSYGGIHIRAILPIWQRLNKLGVKTALLPLTTAYLEIPAGEKDVLSLREFVPKKILSEVDSIGQSMFNPEEHLKLESLDTITYLGWSLYDLIKDVGARKARDLYLKNGRTCFIQKSLANEILTQINPKAIITTNSPRLELALNLKAKEFKIPSFIINTDPLGTNNLETIVDESCHSKIYLWSDFAKRNLTLAGARSNNLFTFGLPHYDYLSSLSFDKTRKNVREKMAIKANEILGIWFTSQNSPGNIFPHMEFESALIEAGNLLNITLGTRIHPHHNYKPLAANFSDLSLIESIAASDFIISTGSTVLIEALHLNKPIIFIDFGTKSNIKLPFHRTGLVSNILQPLNTDNSVSKKNILEALSKVGRSELNANDLPEIGDSTKTIVNHIIQNLNGQFH